LTSDSLAVRARLSHGTQNPLALAADLTSTKTRTAQVVRL
jgi:hypothetical protein